MAENTGYNRHTNGWVEYNYGKIKYEKPRQIPGSKASESDLERNVSKQGSLPIHAGFNGYL